MPDLTSRRGQDRLSRFLAFLIHEEGEARVSTLLQRVNEQENVHGSFFAAIAGDRYMEEILEVSLVHNEVSLLHNEDNENEG